MRWRPDFLVVGAQKCGTTTLYHDLRSHPQVHLAEKESTWLLSAGSPRVEGDVPDGHLTGEVSTHYTMLPKIDGASAARRPLQTVKIIYIVRDPVARVISHHHHHLAARLVDPDINVAVRETPEARRQQPLRHADPALGRSLRRGSVRVVKFEDYVADRQAGVAAIQDFLGLTQHALSDPATAHNTHTEKRVATGGWRRIRQSSTYQSVLRPLLSEDVRRRLGRALLPTPIPRPEPPDRKTVAWLLSELEPEVEQLRALVPNGPCWDLSMWGAGR